MQFIHPKAGTFNFQKIVTNADWSNQFDFDFDHASVKSAKAEVEELMKTLKDLSHAHAQRDLQQHCFPLYFSSSPIDGSKKIVEHIESLK